MIDEIKAARQELKRAKTILQMDELKCRKRVLRRYMDGYLITKLRDSF